MTNPHQSRQPIDADLTVGANIRKLRAENGLTLQELGARLGMSHQQIQKYETGNNRVSAGVLYRLARAFCVPIESLFEGEEDEASQDTAAMQLGRARTKCHVVIDRTASLPALHAITKVLRALQDET